MNINFRVSRFFLLVLVFGGVPWLSITYPSRAQEPKLGIVVIEPPVPSLEAKAVGDVKPFKRTHSDLKASILAHPIPEATLVFVLHDKNDEKVTVTLPAAAKKPLMDCWKAELTFFYLRAFDVHDLQTRIKERNEFGSVVANVQAKLQTMTIDTPTGKRKISLNEAVSLTHLLNNSAQRVVNEAKESVGAKPVAE